SAALLTARAFSADGRVGSKASSAARPSCGAVVGTTLAGFSESSAARSPARDVVLVFARVCAVEPDRGRVETGEIPVRRIVDREARVGIRRQRREEPLAALPRRPVAVVQPDAPLAAHLQIVRAAVLREVVADWQPRLADELGVVPVQAEGQPGEV